MGSVVADSLQSEQVTDRAIEDLAEDLLGHEDFVQRLLRIVQTTHTPANIALFGRWGSGKTGVANRLEKEVGKLDGYRFAGFDAFKHARLPLLRRFLVKIAGELGGKAEENRYRAEIYERKERVDLDSEREWLPAVERWGIRALWMLAAAIWIFNLIAIPAGKEETEVFVGLIGAVFPVLLPAGLVAIAAGVAARYLSVTRTSEVPSSEEEFEVLFSRLLDEQKIGDKAGKEKLVVFVDELDRASAVEVTRTLESLKTFLDQKGCIFIVGADRTVLEHALTRRVRQATPRDLTNPYYSAGSAYLDKIFQYQVYLPPLYPGRLTSFAMTLLADRHGVWDQVGSKEDVVSVLLPVTVHSPRRVKILLNAFAQVFALALSRADGKKLDPQIKKREREVAKLVGLQVEFPLFADDLVIADDLPRLVLASVRGIEANIDPREIHELGGLPAFVRERVVAYAECKLPTDQTLDGVNGADEEMRSAQGSALIDYLRQTELIDGPRTDLVHLEGLGFTTGLDEALAIDLTNLALTNRPEQVRERIEDLKDEDERRRAMLRLLQLVRESRGNDLDNAIRALLVAFPAAGHLLPVVGPDLPAAVIRHDAKRELFDDELPGALQLGIVGRNHRLKRSILNRPAALEEPLRRLVIEQAAELIDSDHTRFGRIYLEELLGNPAGAVERLLA